MIHRQSNDPVLVKKISLRIWSLRDEVEARIKEHLAQGSESDNAADGVGTYLQGLISEYTPGTSNAGPQERPVPSPDNRPALNLIKGGQEEPTPETEASTPETKSELEAVVPSDETATARPEAADANTAETVPEGQQAEGSEEQPEGHHEEQKDAQTAAPKNPDAPIIIRQKTPAIDPSKLCHGQTLLAEIYMDKMSFFAGHRFSEGQSIVIEFLIPKRFIVNADILHCRHYSMKSRIISGQKLPYRVNVKFSFLKPGERTLLREFLESIEPDLSTIKKEVKPKKVASESDGLDDLANLDV